jgi:hypothetical protein
MSTAPSGVEWAFPLQLRTLLAACSGFRTWIDADTVSAATALIGVLVCRKLHLNIA